MKVLDDIISSRSLSKQAFFIKKHSDIVDFLNTKYPNYTLAQKVKFYRNGLDNEPVCKNCNGVLNNPDKKTCSRKCRDILKKESGVFMSAREKARITNLERYGVENPAKSKEVQDKRLKTMMITYGAFVSDKSRESARQRADVLNIKGRETLKLKYGVDNPGQLSDHSSKCKETLINHYGVDHYYKSNEYRNKKAITRKEFWNDYVPSTIDVIEVLKTDLPNERIKFLCNCGVSEIIPHETLKWRIKHTGTPCRKCSDLNTGSFKERQLSDWLETYIRIVRNDRTLLQGKELDILIPSVNIAIEFNGLYWHNDLRISKSYHLEKYLACKEQGIRLIHIFEDEWDFNQDVCKSRILNALGLINEKIYARQCSVNVISYQQAKQFLDKYHLQHYAKAKVKLGLFYKDNLVSVMTFSIPSKSKGQRKEKIEWELLRFCSSVNVVAGASKLLSYFKKEFSPLSIISFCDLRWGTGMVYENMGFTFITNTKPGYWYISGSKRIHRYGLRKRQDEPSDKTEYQLRLSEGYLRIWDCGHGKYIWKNSDNDKN